MAASIASRLRARFVQADRRDFADILEDPPNEVRSQGRPQRENGSRLILHHQIGERRVTGRWRGTRISLGKVVVANGFQTKSDRLQGRYPEQVVNDGDGALHLLEQELPVPPQHDDDAATPEEEAFGWGRVVQDDDRHPGHVAAPDGHDIAAQALQSRLTRIPKSPDRSGRLTRPLLGPPDQPGPLAPGGVRGGLAALDLNGRPITAGH